MAATQQRPRVTGAARRAATLLALVTLVGAWGGSSAVPRVDALTPSPTVLDVDGGWSSTCALVADGTVRCWGDNSVGQLGNGGTRNSIVPVTVAGITTATSIAVGFSHACAGLADGTVRCWGSGWAGQLGNGHADHRSNVPVTVVGLTSAVAVAAGDDFSCALLANRTVWCWGFSTGLGNGSASDSSAPLPVDGLDDAIAVEGGGRHACALRSSREIDCWGSNDSGQLGDGTTHHGYLPTTVAGVGDATAVAAGAAHSCAVHADGTMSCWGSGEDGGLGSRVAMAPLPMRVADIAGASSVVAGFGFTCALLEDGSARCWGRNNSGSLGDGTTTSRTTPALVDGLADGTRLGSGWGQACAVRADASLACWGENSRGQLGDRTVTDRAAPVPVRWDPDTTAPVMTAIRFEVIAQRRQVRATVIRIGVRLVGTDGVEGTGIDHYVVQRSRNGGPWEDLGPSSGLKKSAVGINGTVRFRAYAYDRAGNRGQWRTSAETRVRVVEDSASTLTYGGAWSRGADRRLLDGASHYTRAAGASVSYTFTGWSAGFVTVMSRYRGEVDAYVDGEFVSRFDTSGGKYFRKLIGSVRWSTRGTHTVTFVAVGTAGRPRIDFDALVVIR